MAILSQCPICRRKQANRNKICINCGNDMDKSKRSKKVRFWINYVLPGGKQRREFVGYSIREARDADGHAGASSGSAKDSNTDRRMDRIANLERRVDHTLNDQPETAKSNAAVDAEIASMQREASVDAELEKLRKGGKAKRK